MALEAGGSSPLAHPFYKEPRQGLRFSQTEFAVEALVAQLAEQGTLNPKVEGSIPSERTCLSRCN